MMRSVLRLTDLPQDIEHLAEESRLQGFRILERLISEYESKENCFDQPGEALFAVQQAGVTIAVGGVNRWLVDEHSVLGRVRRVYVSDAVRGEGVGGMLMRAIEEWCQGRFKKLVLFTNTEAAGRFYESLGFEQAHKRYPASARVSHDKACRPWYAPPGVSDSVDHIKDTKRNDDSKMTKRPVVKLKLAVADFDETAYLPVFAICESSGIGFESMMSLGNEEHQKKRLYELNKTCAADIPARGEFFSFDEFSRRRFGTHYDPRGVIVASHKGEWVGMTAISNWQQNGFGFNEMTGVLQPYRRQGIAIALKVLGVMYAQRAGLSMLYTLHDADNVGAIAMNRKLGYIDANWDSLAEIVH